KGQPGPASKARPVFRGSSTGNPDSEAKIVPTAKNGARGDESEASTSDRLSRHLCVAAMSLGGMDGPGSLRSLRAFCLARWPAGGAVPAAAAACRAAAGRAGELVSPPRHADARYTRARAREGEITRRVAHGERGAAPGAIGSTSATWGAG